MELVYLWVEEYKNIKNQGFNFSPSYKYEYDEENQKLTSDENKNYVSIFPDNINVTAIVGENGSGKSGVLECINEIFRIENNKNKNLVADYDHHFNFLLIIEINNEIYEIKSIRGRDSNNLKDKINTLLDNYIYSSDELKNVLDKKLLLDEKSIAQKIIYDYSSKEKFKLSSFM